MVPHRQRLEFVCLAAIWGASFLFIRIAAPEFGPMPLMLLRCLVGAVVLLPLALARHGPRGLAAQGAAAWGRLLVAGVLSSAIPFVMFGFAGLWLTAGFASILNATTPIFGAIVGYFWLRDRLTPARVLGLVVGLAGVALISGQRVGMEEGGYGVLAVLACLVATSSYAISGNFAKTRLAGVDPLVLAAGSQVAAVLVLLPGGVSFWPALWPSGAAWASAAALGGMCTGLAFVLFFRLIGQVSASTALSVTFLIPVFGVFWGWLFLEERVDLRMVLGGAVVVLGTALATGFRPLAVRRGRAALRGDQP
jgi:drug/metabolite transporter (DMT)-like permease